MCFFFFFFFKQKTAYEMSIGDWSSDVCSSDLPRALLAALQAAFPFEHCPAIKTVLRQFGKDAAEIHLPVAQRPEAPRALHPRLVSAVDSLAARRAKLRVFHVKHFHAGVVDVEKREV